MIKNNFLYIFNFTKKGTMFKNFYNLLKSKFLYKSFNNTYLPLSKILLFFISIQLLVFVCLLVVFISADFLRISGSPSFVYDKEKIFPIKGEDYVINFTYFFIGIFLDFSILKAIILSIILVFESLICGEKRFSIAITSFFCWMISFFIFFIFQEKLKYSTLIKLLNLFVFFKIFLISIFIFIFLPFFSCFMFNIYKGSITFDLKWVFNKVNNLLVYLIMFIFFILIILRKRITSSDKTKFILGAKSSILDCGHKNPEELSGAFNDIIFLMPYLVVILFLLIILKLVFCWRIIDKMDKIFCISLLFFVLVSVLAILWFIQAFSFLWVLFFFLISIFIFIFSIIFIENRRL